jgi:hypothetical protein
VERASARGGGAMTWVSSSIFRVSGFGFRVWSFGGLGFGVWGLGGDDLGELLHVGGFDVDDVERCVTDAEIPEIDPEIVGGDEGLAILPSSTTWQ